jgi:signal transduction histidine kinase
MVGDDHQRTCHSDRLVAAYQAALAVAMEVTPEGVLQRIVDSAREVVPARYAALELVDERTQLVQVITSGVKPEEQGRVSRQVKGHSLPGKLSRKNTPLLIPDVAVDPASLGSLPGHPPLRALVGLPILLGGRVLGTLRLAERRLDEQPFDLEDLAALKILAIHAAAAIDRARAYHQAEEQGDHLRIILDSLPAGVMILAAPDGRITLANAAMRTMLFGAAAFPGILPRDGHDLRMLRADGVPIEHEESLGIRALRGEVIRDQQLLIEVAGGRQVPVLVQAVPLPGVAGVVERAVLVLQDHTRLREAEQLKDDFLSLVSHEFRTPLTTIHGGAHLLANRGATLGEETRRQLLGDIVAESNRLDQMLANMLTLTAVMAGRLPIRTEPLLLEPLVRALAAEFAARAPNHDFQLEIPAHLPPAAGDLELLAQVLRNLYENAVKYAPAGGAIRTTGLADGDTVTIEVADCGIGLAAHEVDWVFGRFHRAGVDPSTRGMGLGLYLSHHLVEAQGGRIAANSSGLGQGATFSVTLPLARDCITLHEAETAAERSGGKPA